MKKKIFLIVFAAISFTPIVRVEAQEINNLYIAAMSETFSFPFTRFTPIHPGLEIGTSMLKKEKQKGVHNINVFLGGYYHQKIENGFYLIGEYAYQYKLNENFGIDLPVGGGYQHDFYPGEIYKQSETSGEWEKFNQMGKPHALVTFGFGFTFLKPQKVQPFVRYQSVIDFPLYNGFMTTRTFIKIGVNIKLKNNETE